MQRGLVVEDQAPLAHWLVETLAACFPGIDVRHAATLAEGRRLVRDAAPDIALVDLGLPDGSGVSLIGELAQHHPQCHVVVTTIYADDQHLFPALRAGAAGYLLKDQPREKTVEALRGIASGEPPLSASIARRLLRVFATPPATVAVPADGPPGAGAGGGAGAGAGAEIRLTPRETEVLSLIARGYKIAEVAAGLGVTRNTAHEFVKSVYRKLKVHGRAEAALEATRLGLVNPHL